MKDWVPRLRADPAFEASFSALWSCSGSPWGSPLGAAARKAPLPVWGRLSHPPSPFFSSFYRCKFCFASGELWTCGHQVAYTSWIFWCSRRYHKRMGFLIRPPPLFAFSFAFSPILSKSFQFWQLVGALCRQSLLLPRRTDTWQRISSSPSCPRAQTWSALELPLCWLCSAAATESLGRWYSRPRCLAPIPSRTCPPLRTLYRSGTVFAQGCPCLAVWFQRESSASEWARDVGSLACTSCAGPERASAPSLFPLTSWRWREAWGPHPSGGRSCSSTGQGGPQSLWLCQHSMRFWQPVRHFDAENHYWEYLHPTVFWPSNWEYQGVVIKPSTRSAECLRIYINWRCISELGPVPAAIGALLTHQPSGNYLKAIYFEPSILQPFPSSSPLESVQLVVNLTCFAYKLSLSVKWFDF